jgi:hypothetical protein
MTLTTYPDLAHPHDLLVRRFLPETELMADLLLYYPQKAADRQAVKLLDLKQLVCKSPVTVADNLTEGIGDLRFSASFKGSNRKSNVFLLFEHQSKIDTAFRLRGLDYIVQTYKEFKRTSKSEEKLPYPIVVVLYHGKTSWKHLPEMDDMIDTVPGAKTGLLDYQLVLIDISAFEAEQYQGHPVLQAVLECLQRASEKRLAEEFDRITDRFKSVRNDPRAKGWLQSLVRYAMSVATIGTDLVEKTFCKIINEREAHKMTMTTAEELLIRGETRGEARGKAEGERKGKRDAVLSFLKARFGRIPQGIVKTVNSYNDLIALESLTVQAATCKTLDEFKEGL